MVANLNTVEIYFGIITLVNEGTAVNYLNIFYKIGPRGLYYKTYFDCTLWIFIII